MVMDFPGHSFYHHVTTQLNLQQQYGWTTMNIADNEGPDQSA